MSRSIAPSGAPPRRGTTASVIRPVLPVLGVLLMVLGGCVAPPGAPAGRASPSTPSTGGPGSPAARPTPDIAGSPPGSRLPPPAVLAGGDGGPVTGALGSWTFENDGSDSPWLPAAALSEIQAAPGARLTVQLAGGEPIGTWSAQVAPAADTSGERPSGAGGRDEAEPPLASVALETLPAGRWVLAVRLQLADGRGDATWYWLVSSR